jgi:hypothetical protein
VDASWLGLTGMSQQEAAFGAAPSTMLGTLPRFAGEELGEIRVKPVEGYAFYALYPESYAEAARRSGLPATTRVIGIRSAGTTLAAMVAAGLGAEQPITVRPVGHPFDRALMISEPLAARMLAGDPPAFAIVDEGPGLSGSSFAAVVDWLQKHGVALERIHVFPGHGGEPGAMAGPERLAQWRSLPRHHVSFEELLLDTGVLAAWVEALVGPLEGGLRDISGGGWRALKTGQAAAAPIAGQWERLKFLATRSGERWLVKFAGLGAEGEHKLMIARALHAGGFGPEPVGLCHGFLVERWIEAPGLPDAAIHRETLVSGLSRYLALRAGLTAPPDGGASLRSLAEMAAFNAAEALREDAAHALRALLCDAATLEDAVVRVEVDARLHAWEWLVAGGGLVKTDGLDHARAHDFVGAQDIAWDVAGAIVEHELSEAETEVVIAHLERHAQRQLDRRLLAFLLPCYIAFQLGAWTLGAGAGSAVARGYATKLAALISSAR